MAPGDVVDLRITGKKKQYREAVAERIHEWSSLRAEPFCEHFGTCGGCKWQHIQYPEQLDFKHQQVVDHLTRIAKVALPSIRPILPAHPTHYYRNKLEFTCAEGRWLTTRKCEATSSSISGRWAFTCPAGSIRSCPFIIVISSLTRPTPSGWLYDYVYPHGITLYNLKMHTGYLRTLIIRTADTTQQVMVTLQVAQDNPDLLNGLMNHLLATVSADYVAELYPEYKEERQLPGSGSDQLGGKAYIEEQMDAGGGCP